MALVKSFWPLLLLLLLPTPDLAAAPSLSSPARPGGPIRPDTLRVLFWNVENFFDWRDGGASVSDTEFSAGGKRRWTSRRFFAKCNAIAKTVLFFSDAEGAPPDLIGFAEVENRFVLRKLLKETALRKEDYGIVHYDSPDPRGIDVALLYRKSRLDTLRTFPVPVPGLLTRDMLAVQLRTKGGDSLAVIVCHHPSKYGGAATEPRREAAVRRLSSLSDSLSRAGWRRQVAVGDFNDTPDSPLYPLLDGCYVNLAATSASEGNGSIRYEGGWELIDQCFISPDLAPCARFSVCRIPFLLVKDGAYGGMKPRRTYSGPRWLGGVSDHPPISVIIAL